MDATSPIEFAEPYLQMTTIDPAPETPAEVLADFSRYYTEVHTPDVVRNNPGIRRAYRYELSIPDPNGAFGVKWLSVYEWEHRHGAQVFVVRGEAPGGSWRPDYLPEPPIWSAIGRGPKQWGRLMCNRLAESGAPQSPPAAILMEGFDAAQGASPADAAALRDYFTANHPLAAANGKSFSRVTKYELEELGTKPVPPNDKPQYLAVYEIDEATLASFGGKVVAPAEQPGPAPWQSRRVAWRHVYRRISECIQPGARFTAKMI